MFKTIMKPVFSLMMIGGLLGFSLPTQATSEAMLDLLKILRDKGSISAQEYELLRNTALADGEKVQGKVNEMQASLDEKTDKLPGINTKGKFEIKQGDNTIQIGGRLMADSTVGLGKVNLESEEGHPVTEFRRARMFLSGTWQKYWKFKFQYDFAGQSADPGTDGIRDAYIAYTGFKPATITLGHQMTPLGLEQLTSSKYITFIERSQLVDGIVGDTSGGRKYALSAKAHFSDMFTLGAAGYVGTADEDSAEDAGYGFAGRLTFSPVHEKARMLHLGLGFGYDNRSDGGYNIDGEPEVHTGYDVLETENGSFEKAITFVAEAAGIWGPLALQGEYAKATLKDSPDSPNIDANAWYIYGSYYLTGESRNYKWKKGSYSQTKVRNPLHKGGLGAWELGLRFASGDYENTGAAVSSKADILTAGVNWYPGSNVRFSANYVTVLDANEAADAELADDLEAGASAKDASYLVFRGQWYF